MTNISALSAGACAGKQALFFATGKIATEKALSLCDQCQLYWECLEYTLRLMPEYGVFAGLTRQDRMSMVRTSRRQRFS